MTRNIAMALLLCLPAATAGKGADAPKPKVEVALPTDVITGDKPLALEVQYRAWPKTTHEIGGWRVYAYRLDAPKRFQEATGFPDNASKDPEWQAIHLNEVQWLPAGRRGVARQRYEIPTTGWPNGDYKLVFHALFPPRKNQKNGKDATTLSTTVSFLLTIDR